MKRKHLVIAIVIAALCALMAVPAANAATAKPAQVKGVTAKAASATSVKVTWKTVKNAKGYKVRYSKKASMKGAKTITVKGAKAKHKALKKLKGCTKYYIQVRAYKSAKALGKWSKKKAVKTAHAYKQVAAKAATCTATGYCAHKRCAKCGKTLGKKATAKLGHNYVKVVTDPACTEQGYTTHTCSRCGDAYVDDYTEAMGHSYVETVTEPTVVTQGYTTHTCAGCGDSYVDTYTAHITCENTNAYSWNELKQIASKIGACANKEDALALAKEYNLLPEDGKLTGNETKTISMPVRTSSTGDYVTMDVQVQILGFWHDDKADGTGKTGITFGFKNIVDWQKVSSEASNVGGWSASDMRTWLNKDFYSKLPQDLQALIAEVKKMTNNVGETNDAENVTATSDKVWLLGQTECYGTSYTDFITTGWNGGAAYAKLFNAEGTQYQLYSDNGVDYEDNTARAFLTKCAVGSTTGDAWWVRSPSPRTSDYFRYIKAGGDSDHYSATSECGVAPAFCL